MTLRTAKSYCSLSNYSWGFIVLFTFAELTGLLAVILVGVWYQNMATSLPAFDWNSPAKKAPYHSLFMVFGMIFLYTNAVLVFRVLRGFPKFPLKLIHASIHGVVFIFMVTALQAMFAGKNEQGLKHLYSVHSWLGLLSVILFTLQWVSALIIFLIPGIPQRLRDFLFPLHVAVGNYLLLGISGIAVIGITEVLLFRGNYSQLSQAAMIGNFAGLFIAICAFLTFYLLQNTKYRRIEAAE